MDAEKSAPTRENLGSFGKGLAIILAVFAALSWRRGGAAWPWLLGASAACELLRRAAPGAYRGPFRLWMPIASVLAWINVRLILGLLYFGVLTPYGLLLRLFGKDLLEESFTPAPTYWKPREEDRGRERHESMF